MLSRLLPALILLASLEVRAAQPPPSAPARQKLIVGAAADSAPSGAFQARLGVYPLNTNVAEPLLRLTADYRVEPLLATSWEYRGANTWRFHLRKGVRFHDGQPFTAAAVRASFAAQVKAGLASGPLGEDPVRVVDEETIDIVTTQPDLRLPEQLVHPNYSIFAPGTDPKKKPIGTGPFKFAEYQPYERIVVLRNDQYWGEKPRLGEILFRFIPDSTTRILALLAGEVDLAMDVPREQLPSLGKRTDIAVARAPVGQILSLQMNAHGKAPFVALSEGTVRRAIALAIDRRGFIADVWGGEARLIETMTVPAILGASAKLVHGFVPDLARSRQLLEQAGWTASPDGVRLKAGRRLRLVLTSNPEIEPSVPEYLQAQLRAVGIEVEWAKAPDVGSFAARNYSGQFDFSIGSANQNDGNPLFLPALIYDSRSTRPFARYHAVGTAFDTLVDEGLATADPVEARRLAAEAMHLAIDEAVVMLPLAGLYRVYAAKAKVAGFEPHPSQTNQSWTRVHLN